MKMLCVSNYYPPHFEGGYEISVKETMDYLASRGHEVSVVCGTKGVAATDSSSFIPEYGGVSRVLKYIDYQKPGFIAKHRVEKFNYQIVTDAIKVLNPDLVYIANMKAVSIAPVIAVQNAKVPHVFDLGDIWLKSYLAPGLKGRLFRYAKSILPNTIGGKIELNPVIVLSEWMEQEVRNSFDSKDVYIVPRGIKVSELISEHYDLDRFVFVGRIEPNKGLDLCIEAMSLLQNQDKLGSMTLDVIGEADPEYLRHCMGLIEAFSLQERIRFLGRNPEVTKILSQYSVLLMPTMAREAFGRVVIEAMSLGLVVLATNAYGPKEIIADEEDGFLFDRGSVPALASKIRAVAGLNREQRCALGRKARQKVQEHYEINLVKKKIEIIIESIVNEPGKYR